ncbi:MAG: rhomboid family intramembrane serine protease [Planctomycetota bacterium]
MIPIGDEPSEGVTPVVNYALIAANVLVFVLFQQAGKAEDVVEKYAYVPADPSLLTAFTSMFLHGSWMHLLGNMLFLWIFGDNVEARLGRLGYLCAYLATGLFGGVVHGMLGPTSAIPSLGASGAISGVQGLYVVAFPHNRVKLLIFFRFIVRILHIRAPWIVGFWFVLNDLLPTVLGDSSGGGVAHGAHLGGFGSGLVLCFLLRPFFGARAVADPTPRGAPSRWGPGRIPDLPPSGGAGGGRAGDPWILDRRPSGGDPFASRPSSSRDAGPEILGLARAGRTAEAARALGAALQGGGRPDLPESDYLKLALHMEGMRRFDDARKAFEGILAAYPTGTAAPIAHLGLGLILARHVGDLAAARPHLASASALSTDPRVRAAAENALSLL